MPEYFKNHYSVGGIEPDQYMQAKMTPEQYEGWLLGNIIKYSGRFNWKGQAEQDAAKLEWYSARLNEHRKEMNYEQSD